jgi:hypothetical protein
VGQRSKGQLVPLIDAIESNLGREPAQASANTYYCSEANLAALEAHRIDDMSLPDAPSTRRRRMEKSADR